MAGQWTRRAALLTAPGLALAARGARAQEAAFPTRPVRIIVPFAAGGPTDVIVRIIAEQLGDRWKQPVVVENRGGGGTIVGTNALAQAQGDGYTIGVACPTTRCAPSRRWGCW
jgi:tripartite-type tricarboxylate transporter receptor subunit TctC